MTIKSYLGANIICSCGELVLFPRLVQLQRPMWTGEWEPEELHKQDNPGEKEV